MSYSRVNPSFAKKVADSVMARYDNPKSVVIKVSATTTPQNVTSNKQTLEYISNQAPQATTATYVPAPKRIPQPRIRALVKEKDNPIITYGENGIKEFLETETLTG